MKAYIDADVIAYSAGFASEERVWVAWDGDFPVEVCKDKGYLKQEYPDLEITCQAEPSDTTLALLNTDDMVERIMERLRDFGPIETFHLYLTGEGNFRQEVAKTQPYKGNRTAPRPHHHARIREHLVLEWGARVVKGYEADDALSIKGWEWWRNRKGSPVIMASIDKDLLQVPGLHFSWQTHNKEEVYEHIEESEAHRHFWSQVLTGDNGDNIPGIKGIGNKRATKLLQDCETWEEMQAMVKETYLKKGYTLDQLNETAELVYLLRTEEDKWKQVT